MARRGKIAALKTLLTLEKYVNRLTFSGQEDISVELEDWHIGKKYSHLPRSLNTIAITELSSDLRRVEVMHQIFKALTSYSAKVLDICTSTLKPFSLKLSKGLATLSDDILSLIFKFIVHSDEDAAAHAIRLSHVSQRFRRLSLGDRTLWTTISLRFRETDERMKTFISRFGTDFDLHLAIKYSRFITSSYYRNLVSMCSATASRWRTLFVDGDWNDCIITITDEAIWLMKKYSLTLPRLEEIHFRAKHTHWETRDRGTRFWPSSTATFVNMQTWQAPNLRILRCTQYIPPPSFPFTSFTTFALLLHLVPFAVRRQADDLVAFLNSQPRVSELSLKLQSVTSHGEEFGTEDELNPAAIICPAVTSFQLTIPHIHCDEAIEDVHDIAAPIANAIRMPKLERFMLSIEAKELGDGFTDAGTLPALLIPNPDHHPLLTSFTFTAVVVGSEKPRYPSAEHVEFDIPLDKLPRASTISVKTFGQFVFSRSKGEGQNAAPVKLNALRELQVQSCKHLNIEDLDTVVRSLKKVGAWDTLERVVIRDCRLICYELALEAVGKERLFFSKS